MYKPDAALLAERLNALAETFDKRPVSGKALEVWFDTLRDFPTDRVMGVLLSWPKTNGKFPVPNDVWRTCNDIGIRDREALAEAHRKQNTGPASAYFGPTSDGKRIISEMKAMLQRPRMAYPQRWQEMLANPNSSHLQRSFAQEALRNLGVRQVESEPGQDDEEREMAVDF